LTHVKNFVNETIHLSEVFASSFFTVTFFSFFIGLSAFLLFFVSTTGVVFCAMISAFGAIFLVVNFFVGCAFVTEVIFLTGAGFFVVTVFFFGVVVFFLLTGVFLETHKEGSAFETLVTTSFAVVMMLFSFFGTVVFFVVGFFAEPDFLPFVLSI